jgi:hypothetical protein
MDYEMLRRGPILLVQSKAMAPFLGGEVVYTRTSARNE